MAAMGLVHRHDVGLKGAGIARIVGGDRHPVRAFDDIGRVGDIGDRGFAIAGLIVEEPAPLGLSLREGRVRQSLRDRSALARRLVLKLGLRAVLGLSGGRQDKPGESGEDEAEIASSLAFSHQSSVPVVRCDKAGVRHGRQAPLAHGPALADAGIARLEVYTDRGRACDQDAVSETKPSLECSPWIAPSDGLYALDEALRPASSIAFHRSAMAAKPSSGPSR